MPLRITEHCIEDPQHLSGSASKAEGFPWGARLNTRPPAFGQGRAAKQGDGPSQKSIALAREWVESIERPGLLTSGGQPSREIIGAVWPVWRNVVRGVFFLADG